MFLVTSKPLGNLQKVLISMNSTNEKVTQSIKGAKFIQNETKKCKKDHFSFLTILPTKHYEIVLIFLHYRCLLCKYSIFTELLVQKRGKIPVVAKNKHCDKPKPSSYAFNG